MRREAGNKITAMYAANFRRSDSIDLDVHFHFGPTSSAHTEEVQPLASIFQSGWTRMLLLWLGLWRC